MWAGSWLVSSSSKSCRNGRGGIGTPPGRWVESTLSPHGADARAYIHDARYNVVVSVHSVQQIASAEFPTRWGKFRIFGFQGEAGGATLSKDASRREEA